MDFQKNKKLWIAALIVAGAGTLSGGVYYTWLITPPGPPKTAQEAMDTIGSARFNRMPDYRKQAYMEQAQKLFRGMSEEQRRAMWHNGESNPAFRDAMREMHENAMTKRMEEFAKASPEDRIKILDQIIDQMEKGGWGRGRGGPGGGGPGGGQAGQQGQGGQGHQHGPGQMRDRIERMAQEGNPQRAALRGEFFQAIQQRRQQRGLPPMSFGHH